MVSHCRLCSRCYVQIDHHCLYLYRCIAIGNHRLFVLFTAIVVASMLMFEYSCIIYLRSVYFGQHLTDWPVIKDIFATHPMIWSLFILNGMSIVWAGWVLHMQIVAVSKGRLRAYQSYKARSWLSKRQRLTNVLHFFLNKSPHLRDEVSNPWCTLCLKKVPTFKLSVTLSNLNRFSKFLHCWKAYKICYKIRITLPTSPLACCYTTLRNLKFKFSADIQR